MKLVCISDTHMQESNVKIPPCDILIHAGDYDIRTLDHLEQLNAWFYNQPAKHKICIAGNHDFYFQKLHSNMIQDILNNTIYLENSSVTINGIKFWGSPYTHIFNQWAFMLPGDELKKIWEKIPDDIDVIITHGPPYGILDYVEFSKQNVGCPHLRDRIKEIKPKYHICGHIHGSYGIYQDEYTTYVNASLMNEDYDLVNNPIILEI